MTVWVLFEEDWGHDRVVAIYATKELAEKAGSMLDLRWYVEEFELKEAEDASAV